MPAIIYAILIALLGGSSTAAIREHKQLVQAHKQAQSLQGTVTSLQGAESVQAVEQAREDADRKARDTDLARQAQIRGVYHTATDRVLRMDPPAVDMALQFNTLAMGADDPITATSEAQGEALASATIARQAQLISDLQDQLKQVTGDRDAKTAAIAEDVREKIAATSQIATLTGTVATKADEIATETTEKTDLLSRLSLVTAKYGQWVFWSAVAFVAIFILAHLGLFAHLQVKGQLTALTAQHSIATQTIQAQASTIAAHAQTIATLSAPNPVKT